MEDATVKIVCDAEASEAELKALNDVLTGFGLPAASPSYERKSMGDLPWQVLVTGAPFVAFWSAVAAKAGNDSYGAIKQWLQGVWAARGDKPGSITVIDEPSQTWIVLDRDLSVEALDQLSRLDPSRDGGASGHARWDPKRRTWTPPA